MALGVRQYDRGVRLTVIPPIGIGAAPVPLVINPVPPPGGGVPALPQLHVRFTVQKSLTPEPQRAQVTIVNLQKTTRDAIVGATRRLIDWIPGGVSTPLVSVDGRLLPGDPITVDTTAGHAHALLEAGYGAALSMLIGGVAVARNQRAGSDWRTTLSIGDSELNLTQGQANRSFEPGTPASAVLAYFAQVCSLKVAPTIAAASLSSYLMSSGLVAQGRARQGIADMLGALELTWWVEDGTLWILGPGEFLPDPPLLTSPENVPGMIRLLESPMRLDDGGVAVRMLLAAECRPGRRMLVASSELAGEYRVEHVQHTGDNRTGTFETEAIGRTQNPLGL